MKTTEIMADRRECTPLTLATVTARLRGHGPLERNAELSASGKRVKLPDPYFHQGLGFPELLTGVVWMMTYRASDYLVAVMLELWTEFLEGLHRELCIKGGLSEESFVKLHVDRAHQVWIDERHRWRIHVDLSKELHHESTQCPIVFQTRGPTIEIRTRSRHFKEIRTAEIETETLRMKASTPKSPEKPDSRRREL